MGCPYAPRGWRCSHDAPHDGPCPLWPRWWNIVARWRHRDSLSR